MNRITKLVEELLLLTKDKVNIQALEFEEVNINEEIRSRIKSLKQLHPDNLPKRIHYHLINRHQFEQLLLIFIDNAMKYDKDNKQIEIATQLRNKQISIEITDHGLGIPKEDQEFIFDRFIELINPRKKSGW